MENILSKLASLVGEYKENNIKIRIKPSFHKHQINPLGTNTFSYLIDFYLVDFCVLDFNDNEIKLPNSPWEFVDEVKKTEFYKLIDIDQFVIKGTNLNELKKEIRDNFNKDAVRLVWMGIQEGEIY